MKKKSAAALLLATQLLACADVADLVPPTVDEDPGLPSLELNGTKVHLETFGDPRDPVVIFLHGGPGGGDYRA